MLLQSAPEAGAPVITTRPIFYRLVGTIAVPCASFDDVMTRPVCQEVAATEVGGLHVSTYFLGIDRNVARDGDPILFETKIFGSQPEPYETRCSTWGEAEAMHEAAVQVAMRLAPPAVQRRCSWVKRQICRLRRLGGL